MSLKLDVKIENLPELRVKMNAMGERMAPAIDSLFSAVETEVLDSMKPLTPVFSGRLAKSERAKREKREPFPLKTTIGPTAPHKILVERGTKAHFPAFSAESRNGRRLRRWVQRKLQPGSEFTGQRGARARKSRALDVATFLVARAMSRRGTRAQPFIEPSRARAQPVVDAAVNTLAKAVEHLWQTS